MGHVSVLPVELYLHIFFFLDVKDVFTLRKVTPIMYPDAKGSRFTRCYLDMQVFPRAHERTWPLVDDVYPPARYTSPTLLSCRIYSHVVPPG